MFVHPKGQENGTRTMIFRAIALVCAMMLILALIPKRVETREAELPADVALPYAYLLPGGAATVVAKLQQRGIEVEELREEIELEVETGQAAEVESRRLQAGTVVIRTGQERGWQVASLLEEKDVTVLRLVTETPLLLAKARSLVNPESRMVLTLEMLDKGLIPNLEGDATTIRWLEDGEHFLQTKNRQLLRVHAVTGRSQPYSPGLGDAASVAQFTAETTLAASTTTELHGPFALDNRGLTALAQEGKEKAKEQAGRELTSTDPKGKYNAFVRNNNLYLEEIATKTERALTRDGSEVVRNGKTDWVYYEEVYNSRAGFKHYWWSPDGGHIAFVRLDDSPVPRATVVDYTRPAQQIELTHYPRPGDPNPLVKLAIAPVKAEEGEGEAEGPAVRWVDLSDYAKDEGFLITRVGWLPDGKSMYFCVQDRCQTWLDFRIVGVEAGKSTKVLRDTTKAWVEVPLPPVFLKDGSILLSSERTGWKHLYHYTRDGKLINQVTSGDWEVRAVQRVDERDGVVFFSGTKDTAGALNLYKVKLDGTGLERLTMGKGDNQVNFSPTGRMFVNTTSDPETPPRVSLHHADGKLIRVLDTNPVYVQDKIKLGEFKRVQIPTPDGFLLEASVQKPANFDPLKKYPVWLLTYGGPRLPQLQAGGGKKGGADQALANAGYIVFRCDPRSASNKGAISAWACYKQLGVSELKDLETGVQWLTANPWADAERVGISGHSYGGFLTAYAMCNSKLFAAGVAGAPPTDWRNYDSVYTERYMLTPALNEQGYNATSVVKSAKNLHGRLLLAHGLKDDNVHVQNTFQLVNALQKAGKEFDVMIYPLARHGGYGESFTKLQRDFMKKHLRPEP
jgi:dipeptidyl-peptidase-4